MSHRRIQCRVLSVISLILCACSPVTVELPQTISAYTDPLANSARAELRGSPPLQVPAKVGRELVAISRRLEAVLPDNTLQFRYPVVNTLAVTAVGFPDGEVLLTGGLLATLDRHQRLAALMAHEMAHRVAAHHYVATSVKERSPSDYLGHLHPRERKLVQTMSGLRYSVAQEREADDIARELLRRAGYNDHLYSEFLVAMDALSEREFVLWGLTHPGLPGRVPASVDRATGTDSQKNNSPSLALDGAVIYRSYGTVHLNSEGVRFDDSGLVIRLGAGAGWLELAADTGVIERGRRRIHFRLFQGPERMTAMQKAFKSYNIDARGALSKLVTFRAKSWVTDERCLLLESRSLTSTLVVLSETVAGNCDGVNHRGFPDIVTEQREIGNAGEQFNIRLGYRHPSAAASNPVLLQYLYGRAADTVDVTINQSQVVGALKKVLY